MVKLISNLLCLMYIADIRIEVGDNELTEEQFEKLPATKEFGILKTNGPSWHPVYVFKCFSRNFNRTEHSFNKGQAVVINRQCLFAFYSNSYGNSPGLFIKPNNPV